MSDSLGGIIQDALRQREALRARGLSAEDVARGLEATIRDAWPKPADGRTTPWQYYCEACRDTGLEIRHCEGQRGPCGRRGSHPVHEYGHICTCAKGARFRVPERSQGDMIAAAARTAKAPTRFGR